MEQQLSSNQTNPADPTLVDTQGFQKKQNKSGKKILVILILIAIISAAAYYFFFLNKNNAEPIPEENAEVMENEEVEEVEIDKELDSDQDGLPDYLEKILGTDENNSDTDGDSYTDFDEIKNGYNPLTSEKYTEEEWGKVKDIIKSEDEIFFISNTLLMLAQEKIKSIKTVHAVK
ncbi:MAG: hypothetical protein KKB21_05775, partial [Nanoarchaeota archaeon]|nr:hypothetical protein [Nanoarchaeota archaeon]